MPYSVLAAAAGFGGSLLGLRGGSGSWFLALWVGSAVGSEQAARVVGVCLVFLFFRLGIGLQCRG